MLRHNRLVMSRFRNPQSDDIIQNIALNSDLNNSGSVITPGDATGNTSTVTVTSTVASPVIAAASVSTASNNVSNSSNI